MAILDENFILANGVRIPKIGFGTWQIPNGDICYNSVIAALKAGYRHIDTARAYGNEESVGKAVRDSGLKREEVFVTSKLPAEVKSYEAAKKTFEITMDKLGLEYLDLYLIHAPKPWVFMRVPTPKSYNKENAEIWKLFEELLASGRVKAIGVSNFNPKQIQRLISTCNIKPMANQIRLHIGHSQKQTLDYCKQNGILVEAYSPLATGRILDNGAIKEIAQKNGKSIAQICLRYTIEKGALPLPKSVTEKHIISNTDIDFKLSTEDMDILDKIKTF
jgi:diketogulonate reductase-like aldo/keto reductase